MVHDVVVENPDAARSDGSHRQFAVARRAQLTHEEDVQGSTERCRHLEADRYAAARQCEDHDVVAACVGLQEPPEVSARFAPVRVRLLIAEHLIPLSWRPSPYP